jgi:hypothetical protein
MLAGISQSVIRRDVGALHTVTLCAAVPHDAYIPALNAWVSQYPFMSRYAFDVSSLPVTSLASVAVE